MLETPEGSGGGAAPDEAARHPETPAPEYPPANETPASDAAATEAAPVAPAEPTGPWANDLAQTFQDEGQRQQVDEFLRSKVQPYVTAQEQKLAETEQAVNLYKALEDNPIEAYLQITGELLTEDQAQAVLGALQQTIEQDGEPDPAGAYPPDAYQQQEQVNPRYEAVADYVEGQQNAEAYDAELARIVDVYKDTATPVIPDLFHPFVTAAEGDVDLAAQEYATWYGQAQEKLGLPTAADVPDAPQSLGSDTSAQTTPPVAKDYKGDLGSAIDDFLDETRPSAPPTVGTS